MSDIWVSAFQFINPDDKTKKEIGDLVLRRLRMMYNENYEKWDKSNPDCLMPYTEITVGTS